MNRYTTNHALGRCLELKNACSDDCDWAISSRDGGLNVTIAGKAIDRFAAYEDAGLTPTEIEQMKADNARLHKLVDNIEHVMRGETDN